MNCCAHVALSIKGCVLFDLNPTFCTWLVRLNEVVHQVNESWLVRLLQLNVNHYFQYNSCTVCVACSAPTDCIVFISFSYLASSQWEIKSNKCVRVRHILPVNINQLLFLPVIVGGDLSAKGHSCLFAHPHSACIIYFDFLHQLRFIMIIGN